MKIAIQMDPIEHVDVHADTSFDLALEAFSRGAEVFIHQPGSLSLSTTDGVMARASKASHLARDEGDHVRLEAAEATALEDFDVVLIRQDPPFDIAYITACQLLERLRRPLVLNDPRAIRDAPEKLFVLDFPALTPPTLVTRHEARIRAFRAEHGDVIVKPLYGNGGAGVFRMRPEDGNFSALIELFQEFYDEPAIVQKFLPAVSAGDKRVILIDGEPVGAINRVPQKGETRSNMHVGGTAEAAQITARDREICDAIGPELRRRGLILVGIDVIGGHLTEINVTSPTGVQEVRQFGGPDISALFWDWVEARLSER